MTAHCRSPLSCLPVFQTIGNGASGIAVGMATNIPPHNIAELCDACLHLIKTPDARDDTLLNYVPGPDFPTGGVIVESPENIRNAYATGRGSFGYAKWEFEDLGRGQWQIVITEIPYQVQKSKLIEKIAELINSKKIDPCRCSRRKCRRHSHDIGTEIEKRGSRCFDEHDVQKL